MSYCGPRGIALSDFLRWEPADQDAALEWAAHEAARCSGCGTHPQDWAENPHAHHAHLGDQCPGCLARHRAGQYFKDLDPGVQIVLAPTPAKDCARCTPRRPTGQN